MILKKLHPTFIIFFSLFSLITLWEFVSRLGIYNANLFPSPIRVLEALFSMVYTGELFIDTYFSLLRIILGFLIGSLLGVTLGVLSGRIRLFELFFGHIINLLRPIPPIAIVPLAMLWFGIGESSKVFLIAFGVFFPVWISTHDGVRDVKKEYVWSAKSLGASDRQILTKIILPYTMPFIITGLRVGIGIAFVVLVASELAGAYAGVMYKVSISYLVFRADKMIAGLIWLGILGYSVDRLFVLSTKRLIRWYKES
ncbi:ABC transporter permease [Candidatus Woesearchaeota archaeon]|nr:ABC transporter permease [Candidatus Woesearchaeota archaeon]